MSKGTKLRTIRIGDELWEAAKQRAEDDGRALSDVVRELLDGYAKQAA